MDWKAFLIIAGGAVLFGLVLWIPGYFIARVLNRVVSKYSPRSQFIAHMKPGDIAFSLIAPLALYPVFRAPTVLSAIWPDIPLFRWLSYGLGFYVYSALVGLAISSLLLAISFAWYHYKKHHANKTTPIT